MCILCTILYFLFWKIPNIDIDTDSRIASWLARKQTAKLRPCPESLTRIFRSNWRGEKKLKLRAHISREKWRNKRLFTRRKSSSRERDERHLNDNFRCDDMIERPQATEPWENRFFVYIYFFFRNLHTFTFDFIARGTSWRRERALRSLWLSQCLVRKLFCVNRELTHRTDDGTQRNKNWQLYSLSSPQRLPFECLCKIVFLSYCCLTIDISLLALALLFDVHTSRVNRHNSPRRERDNSWWKMSGDWFRVDGLRSRCELY